MKDYLTVSSGALPKSARVLGFHGKEALSHLYRFEIYVAIEAEESVALDLKAVVGQRATLTIDRDDGTDPYVFHGVFSAVELLREVEDARGVYRLTLVPKLWLLTRTFHSRLYTDKKLPEILEAVLKDAGLSGDEYELKLDGSYEPEEHVCQYRESDFDFLSRWMEREGIYYFFEHGDDKERVVITDVKTTHTSLRDKPVPYHPVSGEDVSSGEAFHSFTAKQSALPKGVALKDYDYAKPSLDVSGKADADAEGKGEIAVYGERFFSPAQGKRLAALRAAELVAAQVVYRGKGGITHLHAGYLFDLERHPRGALNATYLVTEIQHRANTAAGSSGVSEIEGLGDKVGYSVEILAILAEVQFRPARVTPWPRVFGVENAVVDGAASSDYAQIDKQGRYAVKFHFDESDLKDGKATTWVRMLQPHAGNPEGFHFPLRKDTEVLVVFLGGDPDRPVIAGAIPNTATPSPVTSSNNTQNVIHTGGDNRIEIEDKKDAQYIDISTPPKHTFIHLGEPHGPHSHYIVENTEGDCLFNIGGNQDIEVGGDLTEHVVGDVTENYDADQDTVVGGDQTLEVGGDCDEEIGGDQTLEVGGDLDEEIGGDWTMEVGGDWDTEVGGDVTLEAGGDWDSEIGGDVTLEAGGDWEVDIGGTWGATVAGNITIDSTGGTIKMTSPTKIELQAPELKTTTPAKWYKVTSFTVDLYGSKNSLGIQKFDAAGISIGINGMKREATGSSKAVTGSKMELVGSGTSITGMKIDLVGAHIKNAGVNLVKGGLKNQIEALDAKLAALIKIG